MRSSKKFRGAESERERRKRTDQHRINPPSLVLSVLVKVRHVKAQGDEFVQRGRFRFVRRYKGACTVLYLSEWQ